MKLSFPMPGGGTGLTLFSKLVRTKDLRSVQAEDPRSTKPKLTKCLTTLDLTSLGVGSCCGTGMYLVAGMVARTIAGPGVVLSFVIAAVASIFSGACYAEFGVRVPHTSGSAYMYSYVTVGEFVAFVIGWNMILEYLIGTSACACALSASFDSLSGGAITRAIAGSIGTFFGQTPDLIAFGITLLMTFVLVLGASKSVIFNNALNAINFATWVFIMTAGLFYIDTDMWHEHEGFLPNGWSGVFKGAATCFYAFIGFDIIATTGEEAHNPQKSIPKAIVGSLIIVLIAYVTSSLVLTLVVPYDQIDANSALVQMWSYVGAKKCQALVAIGATAGLSVAMFGSMFPMPRVIYAMAQDGLIFRKLAQLWDRTNAPGIATLLSGLAAAFVALLIRLETLVEMMSIGTLLAYTLVSTCVLVLRYQPHSTSLVDLLPPQLRTPQPPSTPDPTNLPSEVAMNNKKTVLIRKVTRGSPDSDDSFGDESPDGYLGGRDDQFLVSDRSENKFYGSVHGAPTGTTATPFDNLGLGIVGRKLEEYGYLCPGLFPWVNPGPATHESGMYVTKLVGIMFILIFFLDLLAAFSYSGTFSGFIFTLLTLGIIGILLVISRQPQNRYALAFLTPGLPFIPAIAITVNIYLIFKLNILTLVRFTLWMALGLLMYFYYGIINSSLENAPEEIELTVDQTHLQPPPQKANTNHYSNQTPTAVWDRHGYENKMAEDSWTTAATVTNNYTTNSWDITDVNSSWNDPAPSQVHQVTTAKKPTIPSKSSTTSASSSKSRPPPPPRPNAQPPSQSSQPTKAGFSGIFIDETQFPTWDD
ncbi:probable cationic amino acid transporter [Contarinia nasturtii]|uniref:probable cationic amino acid transporter n=1 Tax=Contarinia nasturtii TaxID=265458 RepID=UPI0012D41A93|nr:probable cationic amino acid transporter [Contarinia nasturtii]XP_031621294.1 probable cationic amino acid transporter [Contarinia nasturtii]XP_031621295.1 probable cationic amino acid transporter [Contarinia nasturtii]XP_031621296.1 probable cationic amino acid transporter [Contarinia nasturtii]XP_031621297.1 probable cationic amino acid transporter [Contarinia nasturtii]XP_031621298.1 probable cationic amino acid transporter [Contarinia nasturtii]